VTESEGSPDPVAARLAGGDIEYFTAGKPGNFRASVCGPELPDSAVDGSGK